MRPKNIITTVTILLLLFVFLGDTILPKPLSTYSRNTRNTVNNYLIGLFPQKKPKNPHERTEKALEQIEKGKSNE